MQPSYEHFLLNFPRSWRVRQWERLSSFRSVVQSRIVLRSVWYWKLRRMARLYQARVSWSNLLVATPVRLFFYQGIWYTEIISWRHWSGTGMCNKGAKLWLNVAYLWPLNCVNRDIQSSSPFPTRCHWYMRWSLDEMHLTLAYRKRKPHYVHWGLKSSGRQLRLLGIPLRVTSVSSSTPNSSFALNVRL